VLKELLRVVEPSDRRVRIRIPAAAAPYPAAGKAVETFLIDQGLARDRVELAESAAELGTVADGEKPTAPVTLLIVGPPATTSPGEQCESSEQSPESVPKGPAPTPERTGGSSVEPIPESDG
jgi:hypothetical protein